MDVLQSERISGGFPAALWSETLCCNHHKNAFSLPFNKRRNKIKTKLAKTEQVLLRMNEDVGVESSSVDKHTRTLITLE